MKNPGYSLPGMRSILQVLEAKCPRCILDRQVATISATGPVLPHRVSKTGLFRFSSGDLAGPYWSHNGKQRSKIFLSLILCDATGVISILPVNNYGGGAVAGHIRYVGQMYNKIEVFSSDYGTAYQALRANTQKMEMSAGLEALRSATRAREAEKLGRNEAE